MQKTMFTCDRMQAAARNTAASLRINGEFKTVKLGVESLVFKLEGVVSNPMQQRMDQIKRREEFISEFLKALQLPENRKSREIAEILGNICHDDVFRLYACAVAWQLEKGGLGKAHSTLVKLKKHEDEFWAIYCNMMGPQKEGLTFDLMLLMKEGDIGKAIKRAESINMAQALQHIIELNASNGRATQIYQML